MFGWINDGLYAVLNWIQSWAGYWGLAIIIFTIMVRLCLTPLDIKSRASMRKTQKLQPQLQALQKKYANDKEKLNAKTAELYKKAHVNPLSSCLPLLLTWPILIAVFGAMRTVANKQLLEQVGQILNNQQPVLEPFLWIRNLWMPDNLFYTALPDESTLRVISTAEWQTWFNGLHGSMPALLESLNLTAESFESANLGATVQAIIDAMKTVDFYAAGVKPIPGAVIPLVNWFVPALYNGYLLLPILSAASQVVMTKIMGNGTPQPAAEGQPNTGKFMQWFFPLFSMWICLGYSSAFALYWVAGNLVSMGQTFVINKYLDKKDELAAPVAGEGSVR